MEDEFIKVPFYVESDGSKTLFMPRLRRPKGFQIGEKGNERYIENYAEALAELWKMKAPHFRRPNKKNIPGIVTCRPRDVEEVSKKYIEEQLMTNME